MECQKIEPFNLLNTSISSPGDIQVTIDGNSYLKNLMDIRIKESIKISSIVPSLVNIGSYFNMAYAGTKDSEYSLKVLEIYKEVAGLILDISRTTKKFVYYSIEILNNIQLSLEMENDNNRESIPLNEIFNRIDKMIELIKKLKNKTQSITDKTDKSREDIQRGYLNSVKKIKDINEKIKESNNQNQILEKDLEQLKIQTDECKRVINNMENESLISKFIRAIFGIQDLSEEQRKRYFQYLDEQRNLNKKIVENLNNVTIYNKENNYWEQSRASLDLAATTLVRLVNSLSFIKEYFESIKIDISKNVNVSKKLEYYSQDPKNKDKLVKVLMAMGIDWLIIAKNNYDSDLIMNEVVKIFGGSIENIPDRSKALKMVQDAQRIKEEALKENVIIDQLYLKIKQSSSN